MQPLIDFIIDNLLALWPIARVEFWETALRVRFGKDKDILQGGRLHWRWPFADEIEKEPTVIQTLNLAACSVMTSDGKSITISGNVSFRVVNIRKYWRTIHDGHDTLGNILAGRLASVCMGNDFKTLHWEWDELHEEVRGSLQKAVTKYGIRIVGVDLTDFVPTKQYRLYLDHTT